MRRITKDRAKTRHCPRQHGHCHCHEQTVGITAQGEGRSHPSHQHAAPCQHSRRLGNAFPQAAAGEGPPHPAQQQDGGGIFHGTARAPGTRGIRTAPRTVPAGTVPPAPRQPAPPRMEQSRPGYAAPGQRQRLRRQLLPFPMRCRYCPAVCLSLSRMGSPA